MCRTCPSPVNAADLLKRFVPALQDAKRLCREVVGLLRRLKDQRDMSLNEVRLTVAIEDPRARERRLMGMEVGGGGVGCVFRGRVSHLHIACCIDPSLHAAHGWMIECKS